VAMVDRYDKYRRPKPQSNSCMGEGSRPPGNWRDTITNNETDSIF